MKATVEVRKALQSKLEEMIRNDEPVKEVVNHSLLSPGLRVNRLRLKLLMFLHEKCLNSQII